MVSLTGATIASVVTAYSYVPGVYANFHEPVRTATGACDTATDSGGVGGTGTFPGLITGSGAFTGVTDAHAVASATPVRIMILLSFIPEP